MADEKKKETVGENMDSRRTFYPVTDDEGNTTSALQQALQYLGAAMERFDDFEDFPFAAPGYSLDEEGDAVFDEEIYNDSVGVMIGTIKTTVGPDGDRSRVVKAIFMVPIPNIAEYAAVAAPDNNSLQEWIVSILEKEVNHVAVRPLRDAEDVSTVVDQMPTNVEAYTTSNRGAGSGIIQTFNDLYKAINGTLSKALTIWRKRRLTKAELKKGMQSRAYALEFHSALEDRGDDESLFVTALQLGMNAAKKKGLDPTIFERWLATRDNVQLNIEDEDEDELDLDSLTADLLGESKSDDKAEDSDADTEADTEAESAEDSNE